MSELVVIGYDDEVTAQKVLDELLAMQKDYLVDLEDAAVITRTRTGKVKVVSTDSSVAAGTLSGMFWGTLIGLIFLAPIAGLAYGGLIGAAAGGIQRMGIKDDFKRQFADTVKPGKSAIMAVIRRATPDKVIDELKPYGGTVIRTSLSKDSEEELMDMLHGKERRQVA